jgi:hypothetical protein
MRKIEANAVIGRGQHQIMGLAAGIDAKQPFWRAPISALGGVAAAFTAAP